MQGRTPYENTSQARFPVTRGCSLRPCKPPKSLSAFVAVNGVVTMQPPQNPEVISLVGICEHGSSEPWLKGCDSLTDF